MLVAMDVPKLPTDSTDIFSLSDQVLSDRLSFVEEACFISIGFGNWGSVWLCKPKPSTSSTGADSLSNVSDQKIAVKLVHRSKTSTTAARVRSLWNEMKIVRTFKSDPHPSIIPFHSFIITPSYALITMAYLPTLVPVEVDEIKAREWFRFLLSGVEFLHKRGVVHNDIKEPSTITTYMFFEQFTDNMLRPANILLSHKNIPVLVDFGFAEKYDLKSTTAFHSNLSYGTPEYLSPERARGLPHDTRKSDIWSLGVTFFEILIGRTPFENSDGEQFTTKEELEKYWGRTLRGKWVGEWKMSKGMERMLRRMVAPNADLRCTASQAMNDPYWAYRKESMSHRRSSSYTSSIVFEKDMSKLLSSPLSRPNDELLDSPPGLEPLKKPSKENTLAPQMPMLNRARSQPKVMTATKRVFPSSKLSRILISCTAAPRKRVPPMDLSPVKASPPSSPFSTAAGKENIKTFNAFAASANASSARKPFGNISTRENLPPARTVAKAAPEPSKKRILGDVTARNRNSENVVPASKEGSIRSKRDPARDRVREWEREKQRMRERERLEEIERERDETIERERGEEKDRKEKESHLAAPSPTVSPIASSFTTESSAGRRPSVNDSSLLAIKHGIRKSIDTTVKLYKTSTAQITGRSTPALVLPAEIEDGARDWADDILLHNAPSGLPSVRQAAHDERVAADARMDRMTIWMRNVEKVVEDARQTFASSSTQELATLPSLPVAPLSRSHSRTGNRSSRLPRRALAASQIFSAENDQSALDLSMVAATDNKLSKEPTESRAQLQLPEIHTPSRQRRATVSVCSSPEKSPKTPFMGRDVDDVSPSKRREKSKSHGNLFQLHIAPVSLLEAELNKPEPPAFAHRLSQVLDSSLFIARPITPGPTLSPHEEDSIIQDQSPMRASTSFNELTSSPLHVEPYPPRKPSAMSAQLPDTPSQRRIEGVYDRFLMATSGVKRLGKGYQSDNAGPVSSTLPTNNARSDSHRMFHSTRRPMPPPVSSDDLQRRTVSVDELGVIGHSPVPGSTGGHTVLKEDGKNTVTLMRRAIKAIVPSKTSSRKVSRAA
ncbi:hypothetical protein H0H81_002251 [Sphagnurus paluster]|uniref:Protein kinase domain-containing protein n=1 Tax=Sphagnurus paluster TaxID=117069 RepID=A0A9P7GNI9_9AGAR|nr:hypothetical protein H0H81_002251 [Sphagnurus paluster]